MEISNMNSINQWIVEHSCKRLCDVFINPNAYKYPDQEIYSCFGVITDILPLLESLNYNFDKNEVNWLLLSEFCFRIHTSNFDAATDDSDENSSGLFNNGLLAFFNEHQIPEEKLSLLVHSFKQIQEIKANMLTSTALKKKLEQVDKKFINEVRSIVKEIAPRLGPSFLEQLVGIIGQNFTANRLSFDDFMGVMDQHSKQSSDLRQDEFEKTQTIMRKATQNKKKTRKLYNPTRTLQVFDSKPESSGNVTESTVPVTKTTPSPSVYLGDATLSSPRLSTNKARKQLGPDLTPGHSSVSDRELVDKESKSPTPSRSACKDRDNKGFSVISPKQRDREVCNVTPRSQITTSTRTSKKYVTEERLDDNRNSLPSFQKKPGKLLSDSHNTVMEGLDNDVNIDIHVFTDSDAESNGHVREVDLGGCMNALFSDSVASSVDDHGGIENAAENPRRKNSLERKSNSESGDEAGNNTQLDAFAYFSDSEDNSLQYHPRKRRPKLFNESLLDCEEGCHAENEGLEQGTCSHARQAPEVDFPSVGRNVPAERRESINEVDEQSTRKDKVVRPVGFHSPSSDDSILEEANLPMLKVKQPKRRYFTQEEEEWLRDGVRKFGVGKWKAILESYRFKGRTVVNLKDKWRNLVKSGLT